VAVLVTYMGNQECRKTLTGSRVEMWSISPSNAETIGRSFHYGSTTIMTENPAVSVLEPPSVSIASVAVEDPGVSI
jgi:hypothetical protein